jgi:pimeloyl-ACP methyl ester carboxylesterase
MNPFSLSFRVSRLAGIAIISAVTVVTVPVASAVASANGAGTDPPVASETKSPAPAGAAVVRKIDIGGRKFTLSVRGRGGPTVVIEPGMGLPAVESGEWDHVCDEIARTNRVVLYDRAGLGTSDPADKAKARTANEVARDLHALLAKARVPGPYVLVGHSIGGLYVRVYADRYPDDVAAVVLVEATHPDQEAKWLAALPPAAADEDPAVAKAREFLTSHLKSRGDNPDRVDIVATRDQVRAAKPLGDKPLVVLTHSPDWKMVPDLPDDVSKRLEQITQELQAETARLSTKSTHTVAKRAGHGIHVDEPELVIEAIRSVAAKQKPAGARKAP